MICNHTVILVVNQGVWQPGKLNWIWTLARYGASWYNWGSFIVFYPCDHIFPQTFTPALSITNIFMTYSKVVSC